MNGSKMKITHHVDAQNGNDQEGDQDHLHHFE
jgi:hypothetical protein